MLWRSVVFKLWFTIILLVAFVLMILTIFLLEFFENFYVEEAEESLMNEAENVSSIIEEHEDLSLTLNTIDQLLAPQTRVTVFFNEHQYWQNDIETNTLPNIDPSWFVGNIDINHVFGANESVKKITEVPNGNAEIIIVGIPTADQNGAIYVYQSLDVVEETTTRATKLILIAATVAIILTTIFAFFLTSRITAPLMKMRKAAGELSKGEFHTKVPVLTHDEIGELAISFNRMRRQLNYHITALNQEKSQLSSILRSLADGVITVNKQLGVMLINPPAEQFLAQINFTKEEEPHSLPVELRNHFQKVIEEENEYTKEIVAVGRNFVLIMTPLYIEGSVRGAVAIIRDMTEERQLDKLRKDFLANVSHELRTPISMMQGYAEAIVDDIAESKEEKQELAQIIYDESLRMNRLVNELLDLARMEAGHIQINHAKVPVKPFIDRVIKKFSSLFEEQEIELRTNVPSGIEYYFDPDRIEQVMTNLIDNALRHTNEDGKITIDVEEQKNELVIHIKDNGSGIPEEDLPFIFERFYKSDKSRTRNGKKKGTGLGLSIAKHIIEAHNGSIYAKSKESEGTTFTFTIPKKED
ncbi:ATP-binding protein [Tenuibacillus multivorans]|uniref:histidine kinase n=1 Tax=Tenuibacillus multivorans TaxID=237069 RepID=A0A1H0CXN9_9BACI|nr:ATP-binding protein [Tenuibacillus multivorans]GEL76124.1 sensor histidine kinase ResE [Tenuibacillus multivorans]SDN62667.1 two-component system, OmpR family, sensor histidine kinase ResE [Tenuibacillus multivorans]